MFLEKISSCGQLHTRRQIRMAIRTKILVLFDELRWFVVLEVAACASLCAEYRYGGRRRIDVPVCFMALQTGDVFDPIERLGMAVLTLSTAFRMLVVKRSGEP